MAKQFNIFGDIVANESDRWFDSDVPASIFVGWLTKQEGDIEININSNGGDVAGGLAIANAIKGYKKGEITCNVLGLAASMASVIACAGKRLCMGQGAFLMIHNPWTVTQGNAEDLRKDADTLDKMRDSSLSFYQSKSTKSAEELKELMDAETWISREMANDFGFEVEDYEGELRAAASLTRRAFAKAPDGARGFVDFKAEKPGNGEPAPETPAEAPAPTDGEEPAPAPETPAEAPEAAPEPTPAPAVSEEPAPTPEKPAPIPAENWEARFKGLSAKFNDLQRRAIADLADVEKKHADALQARDVENASLKSQLETSVKDLADANAKVSELSAKLDESTKALQTATADLAQVRDSLKAAEDKATELEKTRDLLTAGVLTPPATNESYAAKMKAAKTPEERENLRAQKRAGKIK